MPLFGLPGERIGYELYPHPDDAPPLVLIHGFTASKASFEANIAGLNERFTVVTVELLGHGDSDAPDDPAPYRPERAVGRILQLLQHLGYSRVLLCGHSLGGALALRLALDAPEWVAGLIVINSSSAAGDPAWRESARPRMQEMGARVRAEGTAFMKQTRLYPAHSRRLDAASRQALTDAFDRLQPAGVAGTAEGLVVDVNAWERHPLLSVPMLLVVGERDGDFAPNAAAFLQRFPRELIREERLPHAGHAANIEQPREFEAAVVRFARDLRYLPPSAPGANRLLTALGGALVVAGIGLLAAAIFFNGDDDSTTAALGADAPPTSATTNSRTPTAQVAGSVVTTQPTRPNVPAAVVTPPGSTATSAPAPTATSDPTQAAPTATIAPAQATPPPQPTATPQATSTPEPTATSAPQPTATPSGPVARINGPTTGVVGAAVVLNDASSPLPFTWDWTLPSGARVSALAAVSFTPTLPGCYTTTMTAYFAGGAVRTTSLSVSVGGVSCGG